MFRVILSLLIFGFFIVTYSDSLIQTDWSGGPGILGPVSDWSNRFYIDIDVEWCSIPGDITLQLIAKHVIDEDQDAVSVYSEDLDGDGDMDVISAGGYNNDITWWENIDGSGISWNKHTVDDRFIGSRSVYSEDIDGDSDMDVLGAAAYDDEITWWENIDGSGLYWKKHTVESNFVGAVSVHSEDIDGDGDLDVLGAAQSADRITWWENIDGLGTSWVEHTVAEDFSSANSVYSEDINGDGDMDILGAAAYDDDITWWENIDGSGTSWTEHIIDADFNGAFCVYSADIDDDGDKDVLGAAFFDDDITWWENIDGLGTSWIEHTVEGDFFRASSVYSEDIDDDGDMDVLGTALYDCEIAWWENIGGSGTSWIEHTVDGEFDSAMSAYSTDINGDGNMDILGTAYDITWWDLTRYSPGGSLESSILNTGCSPQWASIDWNSSEPAGTDLYFQYKTSNDFGSMGNWSNPIHESPFLCGSLDQYFQYKVSMETDNQGLAPTLHDLTLNWDTYGIEGDPIITVHSLIGATPNPAYGTITIQFAVSEMSPVKLSVFDLAGRHIVASAQDDYVAGYHQVQFEELAPGIYFCRMISGEFTATQNFIVIE